jgi:hypothetical protein
MGHIQPNDAKPQISAEDVKNYLTATHPGLLAVPREMLDDCRKQLQEEADSGHLTEQDLRFYAEAARRVPAYDDGLDLLSAKLPQPDKSSARRAEGGPQICPDKA